MPPCAPDDRAGLGSRSPGDALPASDTHEEERPVGRLATHPQVSPQRTDLRRPVGKREQRAALGRRRQAQHRESGPGLGDPTRTGHACLPARKRVGLEAVHFGERHRAQDHVGEDAETTLRAEHQLAQVRSGSRRGVGGHVQRPGRCLERAAREQLLDPPSADAPEAGAASRHPAASGRQLKRLWLVTDGEPPLGKGGREIRAGDPRAGRDQAAPLVQGANLVEGAHVDRDDRIGRWPCAHAADHAGAAAVRDQPGTDRLRVADEPADVVVAGRPGDGIGHRGQAPGSQLDEVWEGLASGTPDPKLRIRVQEPAEGVGQARGGDARHDLGQRGIPWCRRLAHQPFKEPARRRAHAGVVRLVAPAVPAPHAPIVPQREPPWAASAWSLRVACQASLSGEPPRDRPRRWYRRQPWLS